MPGENHPDSCDHARWWLARAGQTARKVNLAWFFETLTAPLVIGSAVVSAGIVVVRSHGSPIGGAAAAAITTIFAAALAFAWIRARRRFETPEQSLVRIESALGLHNALSAAQAGAAPWPEPVEPSRKGQAGLRWQWRRLTIAPGLAVATLAASLWIPVHRGSAAATPPPRQPLAWSQLDQELDALMETAVIEETYLDETRDRIEQLRSRDPAEWYSHNTLEATDSLAESHRSESHRLEDAMARAGQALERMRNADPDVRLRQFDEYQRAIENMANGAMRPNEEMRKQLEAIGRDNLNQLTGEQLDQLRQQLRDAQDAMKDAQGLADPEDWADGPPMPGMGDPDEDGEHAPGVLGERSEHEMEDGEFTPLAARDLSKAALGDLLEIQTSPHGEDDPVPQTPQAGGTADATGRGGDRIWRDALDPDEQRTLRKFFE